MSWEPEVEEIKRRAELAKQMGGEQNVARHHANGRLTVRERIERLLDSHSFHEVGALAGRATYETGQLASFTPANFVFGTGRIDGRKVVVGGDDFTVRGGAADGAVGYKAVYAERLAREFRVPLVRLVDGTGGGGSVKTIETMGRTYVPPLPGWDISVALLAEVPVVGACLGSVAGLGAVGLPGGADALDRRPGRAVAGQGRPGVRTVRAVPRRGRLAHLVFRGPET